MPENLKLHLYLGLLQSTATGDSFQTVVHTVNIYLQGRKRHHVDEQGIVFVRENGEQLVSWIFRDVKFNYKQRKKSMCYCLLNTPLLLLHFVPQIDR